MSAFSGYGQFCPVAKACEVFAERWTLMVVRELHRGSRRFVDIRRGIPLMSPSLLSSRLKDLERLGVVARRSGPGKSVEYHLTDAGRETWPIVEQLGNWGQRWAMDTMRPDEADAGVLMWDIRCRVPRAALPKRRVVLHFEFRDGPPSQRYWWLLLDANGADLCWSDPGHSVDLTVRSDVRSVTLVWMGIEKLEAALRAGKIVMEGARDVRNRFVQWFPLNYFAGVPRASVTAVREVRQI